MARRGAKSKSTIKVDFTGVESSGKVAEGRQLAEVAEVELRNSESGNDYLNWKLKAPGGNIYHTTSLQPQALWNLRNMLEALGLEVPDSTLELDLSEYPGMELGIEVENEVYQGKKRPVIIDLFPADDLDDEGGARSAPEKEEEEEEDDLTYESVMEMEKEELLDIAEGDGIKVPVKTRRNLKALREFMADKLGLEAEEEEAEEEKPSGRRNRRKTATKELKKGSQVEFEDDGEMVDGKVLSVNTKEGFAVVDVDGEEWEVELDDIKVK